MTSAVVAVLVVAVCLTSSGCETLRGNRVMRCAPVPRCVDGLPPKALVHVTCMPDGICGYSCVPNRWQEGD